MRTRPNFTLLAAAALLPLTVASRADDTLTITSEAITARISTIGAELQSVVQGESQHEYIWQAPNQTWSRHSPLLFPIIGGLREPALINEKHYKIPFHGFARNQQFEVVAATTNHLRLELNSSPFSERLYPYPFTLTIDYRVTNQTLSVSAELRNDGEQTLPASIGFHPGFNISLAENEAASMTSLVLSSEGKIHQLHKDDASSFLSGEKSLYATGHKQMAIHQENPGKQAIVLATPEGIQAILTDRVSDRQITLKTDAPNLGIWRKSNPNSTFLCLEPWWGTTDPIQPYGEFINKPGLLELQPDETRTFAFELTFN